VWRYHNGNINILSLYQSVGTGYFGLLLAISADALVYVGASHLLPAVERENKNYSVLALAAGVLVAVIIVLSKT
jgi:hypothetical protein